MNENQVNTGFKIFGFLKDNLKEALGAFLIGTIFVSVFWYIFYKGVEKNYDSQIIDKNHQINDLKTDLKDKNNQLKNTDKDCSDKVLFFTNMLTQIQDDAEYNKQKSKNITESQQNSLSEIKKIKRSVKSKIR